MEIEWDETCVRCGAKLPEGVRISRDYCSRRCYMEGYQELETQAIMEARANRPPCANCGKPIPMTRDMRAIYCSPDCNKGAAVKVCPHCQRTFRGQADQVHCSWFCYGQTAKRIHQPRPCQWCGATITQPHKDTRYCSWSCAGKAGMQVRLNVPRPVTARLLDRMFHKLRPKRAYRQRLTAARLDAMLERGRC